MGWLWVFDLLFGFHARITRAFKCSTPASVLKRSKERVRDPLLLLSDLLDQRRLRAGRATSERAQARWPTTEQRPEKCAKLLTYRQLSTVAQRERNEPGILT